MLAYESQGFSPELRVQAGTLYKAFKHKEKGFVDVFVMYKWFDQVTLCYQV